MLIFSWVSVEYCRSCSIESITDIFVSLLAFNVTVFKEVTEDDPSEGVDMRCLSMSFLFDEGIETAAKLEAEVGRQVSGNI